MHLFVESDQPNAIGSRASGASLRRFERQLTPCEEAGAVSHRASMSNWLPSGKIIEKAAALRKCSAALDLTYKQDRLFLYCSRRKLSL
jgi:hypothetical protein